MILLISNWDYSVAGAESLIEQLQEEGWSPGAALSRSTPRVLQPANVRLIFFPVLTGHFYVLITVGTAAFLHLPTASRQKLLWLSVLLAGLLFSLLSAGISWDTE